MLAPMQDSKRRSRRLSSLTWSAGIALILGFACGRPATREECELIVERVAELELKAAAVTDARVVEEQVAAAKSVFQEQAQRQCVGRRIPSNAMNCVRQAKTAREIVEDCF